MPETRRETEPFDLQAAINAAKPGDVIDVPTGFVVNGPITFPRRKHGFVTFREWITLRSTPDP